jgi:hypothetical protein
MARRLPQDCGGLVYRLAGLTAALAGWTALVVAGPPAGRVAGEITAIAIAEAGGGAIVVQGRRIAVPADVPWRLPGQSLTIRDVLSQAPAGCLARRESGLLRTDACASAARPEGRGAAATVTVAQDESQTLTATEIRLPGERDLVSGGVTYVSRPDGYIRIRGVYGTDRGGTIVRLNDPTAALSIQQGAGCGAEANCSPDVRFRVGLVEPTVRFTVGPAACVPAADGLFCPPGSRDPASAGPLPIKPGDHAGARGALWQFDGEPVLFAHSVTVQGSGMSAPGSH